MPFNLHFLDNKHFRSVEREISVVRWCHIIQGFLAFIVILFSIIRIGTKNVSSRADTWTMSVGFKTLVVLTYLLLVSKVEKLKRFASLKTNMVLSIIELLFWIVAFFMTIVGIGKSRNNLAYGLAAVVIISDFILVLLAIPVALISIRHFRYLRQTGSRPEDEKESNSSEFHRLTTQRSLPF